MKPFRPSVILYLLPYLLLLLAGLYKSFHCPQLALMDSDSGNYLIPPFVKQLTGEWHKGERPMQYLAFIYFTLAGSYQLKYTVLIQHILHIAGAGLLAGAWLLFIQQLKGSAIVYHVLGWLMLAIYISSPQLMYYAQFVGPESISMFIMCLLIFCLAVSQQQNASSYTKLIFTAAAMFFNLYLAGPMPKCVFTSIFLEVVLLYVLFKIPKTGVLKKTGAVLMVHALFLIVVVLPERANKINFPHEDRTNIEYEQMVYTHFDLLAQDRSNFALPGSLEDSLEFYFSKARLNKSGSAVLGFNNDDLMWGSASNLIKDHYRNNEDTIANFYKRLSRVLITRYPVQLARQILKQIYSFYWPNNKIHKDLYGTMDIETCYNDTKTEAADVDIRLKENVATNYYMQQVERLYPQHKYDTIDQTVLDNARRYAVKMVTFKPMVKQYPGTIENAGFADFDRPWPGLTNFFIIRFFDIIFLTVMAGFFMLRLYKRQLLSFDLLIILYTYIFIYVATVAVVHTFDIGRFVTTIYPFFLLATFMGAAYIFSEAAEFLFPASNDRD